MQCQYDLNNEWINELMNYLLGCHCWIVKPTILMLKYNKINKSESSKNSFLALDFLTASVHIILHNLYFWFKHCNCFCRQLCNPPDLFGKESRTRLHRNCFLFKMQFTALFTQTVFKWQLDKMNSRSYWIDHLYNRNGKQLVLSHSDSNGNRSLDCLVIRIGRSI